eukprot:COSAG01_NODE_4836_length_4701_cov_4.677314_4_plen_392_part_00
MAAEIHSSAAAAAAGEEGARAVAAHERALAGLGAARAAALASCDGGLPPGLRLQRRSGSGGFRAVRVVTARDFARHEVVLCEAPVLGGGDSSGGGGSSPAAVLWAQMTSAAAAPSGRGGAAATGSSSGSGDHGQPQEEQEEQEEEEEEEEEGGKGGGREGQEGHGFRWAGLLVHSCAANLLARRVPALPAAVAAVAAGDRPFCVDGVVGLGARLGTAELPSMMLELRAARPLVRLSHPASSWLAGWLAAALPFPLQHIRREGEKGKGGKGLRDRVRSHIRVRGVDTLTCVRLTCLSVCWLAAWQARGEELSVDLLRGAVLCPSTGPSGRQQRLRRLLRTPQRPLRTSLAGRGSHGDDDDDGALCDCPRCCCSGDGVGDASGRGETSGSALN